MNASKLDPAEQKVLDDIRDHGCQVMYVRDDKGDLPDFSYSIGFPVSAELTCTVSLVPVGPPNNVADHRSRAVIHSLRMASIMRHPAGEIAAASRLLP